MRKLLHKRGGVIGDLISGTGGIVILVIITLVIIATLLGAGLMTTDSIEENVSTDLKQNLTEGIQDVAEKIPTILTIAAVVLLFGVLVLLVAQSRAMGIGGGSSL